MALTQVKSDGIATGAVTATQIATGAVTANDLEDSGVTAGTYGSSSAIPAITVDAKGRITSASTNSVTQVGGANGVSFNDNVNVRFGTGNDFAIFHDGGNSILDHSGTGGLRIVCNNDDSDITLESDNGAGSTTTYVRCDGSNGSVRLYDYGAQKLTTNGSGINVTGTVECDGVTNDGTALFRGTSDPQVVIQDSNSTGDAAETGIIFRDSAGTDQGRVGVISSGNADIYLGTNTSTGRISFQTNTLTRIFIEAAGHLVPNGSNTYDLGSSNNRWRNVYTNDLNLSNEGGTNDVDGTWGSWTIQEGEDDLFLLNRRNGKKYKFNLSEVS